MAGGDLIVLAFDDSPDALRACAWTRGVAAARGGARVDLVHAVALPVIPIGAWDTPVGELLERNEREIRTHAEREQAAFAAAGVPARVFLRRWLPVDTILDHAREQEAGLIVLGQHGSRPGRMLLGSVSGGVARSARRPVVVVRGRVEPSPPRSVLLAHDGSAAADEAAAAVARWLPAARVIVVTVHAGESQLTAEETLRRAGAAGLDAARLETVTREGDPAAVLLELAETTGCGLVAVGRRGLSPFRDLLLGGVSEKLLQLAPCPVMAAH